MFAFLMCLMCYMHSSSHPPPFDHCNDTGEVYNYEGPLMQSSSTFRQFLSLKSKYSPQHPLLRHLQYVVLLQCESQSFTPIQNNR